MAQITPEITQLGETKTAGEFKEVDRTSEITSDGEIQMNTLYEL